MEPKKVVIIGGGISGLAACKFILSKGLIPIVVEARGAIGGVWSETLKSTIKRCFDSPISLGRNR